VIAAFQVDERPWCRYLTLAVFVAIALGDALDGYIARRFNLSTREGKFIDPLADKLTMTTACIMLAFPIWGLADGGAPLRPEIATIIVARDVIICAYVLVALLAGERSVFEPTKLGRFTTFAQMSMIAAALMGTINTAVLELVARPLSYTAAALTIASGGQYLYKHAKIRSSTVPISNGTPENEANSGSEHD
jgi:cardiolipin synthase